MLVWWWWRRNPVTEAEAPGGTRPPDAGATPGPPSQAPHPKHTHPVRLRGWAALEEVLQRLSLPETAGADITVLPFQPVPIGGEQGGVPATQAGYGNLDLPGPARGPKRASVRVLGKRPSREDRAGLPLNEALGSGETNRFGDRPPPADVEPVAFAIVSDISESISFHIEDVGKARRLTMWSIVPRRPSGIRSRIDCQAITFAAEGSVDIPGIFLI